VSDGSAMPIKRPSNAAMKPAKKKPKATHRLSDESDNAVSQSSDEDIADPTSHHGDEKVQTLD
jgi:hypothetical protein